MEGWPEGWTCYEVDGRVGSINGRFVVVGDREGCRRAAWAIEGGPTIDREKLAKALHDAVNASGRGGDVWGDRSEDTRQGYLAEADEAIRLLGGLATPAKALYDEIEGLGRANAALQDRLTSAERGREDFRKAYNAAVDDYNASVRRLTETANAAVERAKAAEDWADELCARHTRDLSAALDHTDGAQFGELVAIVAQRSAMLKERDRRISALTTTADAAIARAEEAQLRAQRAEEERDILRDYDSPFEQDAEDLRAEMQRLQSVVARTAQAAARLADALGEMAGGDDA